MGRGLSITTGGSTMGQGLIVTTGGSTMGQGLISTVMTGGRTSSTMRYNLNQYDFNTLNDGQWLGTNSFM